VDGWVRVAWLCVAGCGRLCAGGWVWWGARYTAVPVAVSLDVCDGPHAGSGASYHAFLFNNHKDPSRGRVPSLTQEYAPEDDEFGIQVRQPRCL
jgi:hypothetical protein